MGGPTFSDIFNLGFHMISFLEAQLPGKWIISYKYDGKIQIFDFRGEDELMGFIGTYEIHKSEVDKFYNDKELANCVVMWMRTHMVDTLSPTLRSVLN